MQNTFLIKTLVLFSFSFVLVTCYLVSAKKDKDRDVQLFKVDFLTPEKGPHGSVHLVIQEPSLYRYWWCLRVNERHLLIALIVLIYLTVWIDDLSHLQLGSFFTEYTILSFYFLNKYYHSGERCLMVLILHIVFFVWSTLFTLTLTIFIAQQHGYLLNGWASLFLNCMQGNSVTGFVHFTDLFNPFLFFSKAAKLEYLVFLCDKYAAVSYGGACELMGASMFVYLYVYLCSYVFYERSLIKSAIEKTKRETKIENDEI